MFAQAGVYRKRSPYENVEAPAGQTLKSIDLRNDVVYGLASEIQETYPTPVE